MNKNFQNFTNLYEISKTLRFELKPQWNTDKLLIENKVFKKDKNINEAYYKIKWFLDKLHLMFINESLSNINLDFNDAFEIFKEIDKEQDTKKKNNLNKEFEKIKSSLRKQVCNWFKNTWNKWKEKFWNTTYIDNKWKEHTYKIKWDSYKILMSETNLNILYQIFNEETCWDKVLVENYNWEKENIFRIFKWFTTYFTNFNHSRDNFYKDDWKTWRIATRIINENMIFFFKNKIKFDKFYSNESDLKKKLKKKLNNLQKKLNNLQNKLDNHWETLDEFFNIDNYNNCFKWDAITNYYNMILWWITIEGKKIQWLNEIINLEKQAKYSEYKQAKKDWNNEVIFQKNNYPVFKELYKQILSQKEDEIKFIEIENFNDIKKYLKEIEGKNIDYNKIVEKLISSLTQNHEEYNFDKIYLSKLSINTISAKFFGFWKWELVSEYLKKDIWIKNSNKKIELPDFISLDNIKNALILANKESEDDIFKNDFEDITINDVFIKFLTIFIDSFIKNINIYNGNKKKLQDIYILSDFDENNENKEKQIEIIKDFLDSSLNIYRMMKYFSLEKGKENIEYKYEIDDLFYNNFSKFYTDNQIFNYYNEFRNYLTKKPYSTDKIKLNFENGNLLDGWDKNKEPDNFWTLLRKDWKYYLALQVYLKKNIFYKKQWSSIIDIQEAYKINENELNFKKIDYKLLPWANKMLPKVFFANNNIDYYNPSEEILNIRNTSSHTKWWKPQSWFTKTDFSILDCRKMIDFYKKSLSIHPEWKNFKFNFSETSDYEDTKQFFVDVEKWWYNLSFREVSEKYINNQIDNWNIYLFEIYNKDFAKKTTWKQNLHTMYFKWLFEEKNLKDIVLKLNWQAEIFRREASIKERIDKNRKTKNEIIEKRRYTQDKLFFHCPISLNYKKENKKINNKILEYISENKEINIIWIDRGEKHLAYYSVINQKWEILKDENWELVKWSFNEIWWKNYYNELVKREWERTWARKDWKTIWNIKDLKQWYISQVVHKLSELIIKYNAIIVFEDLNSWFKRWRQKIERQVYQKLEKALIEKLNYLTFKDRNIEENWSYLKAYQLTAPFETFEKVWKQTWIIFYTNPAYTSSTCPDCWFRKDIYLKYTNLLNAKKDIKKIDSITFNCDKFIFEYNNKKVFSDRDRKRNLKHEEKDSQWKKTYKWKTENYNITYNIEQILSDNKIDYKTWENLINNIIDKNNKELYSSIFYNFNSLLTIRNSTIWENDDHWDFISCPCCDFDSRKQNNIWISNWDDNWAYNIARKWIIILNKINNYKKDKGNLDKIWWKNFTVNQKDWDNFIQK